MPEPTPPESDSVAGFQETAITEMSPAESSIPATRDSVEAARLAAESETAMKVHLGLRNGAQDDPVSEARQAVVFTASQFGGGSDTPVTSAQVGHMLLRRLKEFETAVVERERTLLASEEHAKAAKFWQDKNDKLSHDFEVEYDRAEAAEAMLAVVEPARVELQELTTALCRVTPFYRALGYGVEHSGEIEAAMVDAGEQLLAAEAALETMTKRAMDAEKWIGTAKLDLEVADETTISLGRRLEASKERTKALVEAAGLARELLRPVPVEHLKRREKNPEVAQIIRSHVEFAVFEALNVALGEAAALAQTTDGTPGGEA